MVENQRINRSSPRFLLLASVLVIGACAGGARDESDQSVVGDWEILTEEPGPWARMTVESDLDGDAVIDTYFSDTLRRFEFDFVVWQSGNEWEFMMECKGGCDSYSFLMECVIVGEVMTCEADGLWADVALEWTRK